MAYVYILASSKNGTLYIGMTSNLTKRIYQHKQDQSEGFTSKYAVKRLVHFEQYENIIDAIQREKQLKRWNRNWKIELIEKTNPNWNDLWDSIIT